jgi:hypothetical protein
MEEPTELYNKEGCVFTRQCKNKYTLHFQMENNHIYLSKVINFSLIQLIYELNPDIYENIELKKINEEEGIAIILIKHFFEDLGLPQRYSFINIKKHSEKDKIIFKAQTIKAEKPTGIPKEAEILSIDDFTCVCNMITQHKGDFSFHINFNSGLQLPPFVEKMIGVIIHKIFKRVKQFIENVRV